MRSVYELIVADQKRVLDLPVNMVLSEHISSQPKNAADCNVPRPLQHF